MSELSRLKAAVFMTKKHKETKNMKTVSIRKGTDGDILYLVIERKSLTHIRTDLVDGNFLVQRILLICLESIVVLKN